MWISGPTRTGKSMHALSLLTGEQHPFPTKLGTVYTKNSKNHWWCGYTGQEKVLIDELPVEASKWCITYLKQWGDSVPILLERKGSTVPALFTHLIVTCQHSIRRFFEGVDERDVAAIEARYEQLESTHDRPLWRDPEEQAVLDMLA